MNGTSLSTFPQPVKHTRCRMCLAVLRAPCIAEAPLCDSCIWAEPLLMIELERFWGWSA